MHSGLDPQLAQQLITEINKRLIKWGQDAKKRGNILISIGDKAIEQAQFNQ